MKMKKFLLFAGLAVATLSFVGCNKQEMDFAGNDGKFTIKFATPETKTSNDGMSTKWVKGDGLTVFYAKAGTTDYSANTKFSFADEDAAENGLATGEATLEGGSYDWYAIYPYAAKYTTPANTDTYATVGSSATGSQTQKGLNSTAHLAGYNYPLVGRATSSANASPVIQMKQVSSVIAVNVKNTTSASVKVNSVSVTAPVDLVGGFFIDFSKETPVMVPEEGYTSKTAKVAVTEESTIEAGATATFYLAVAPFSLKSQDLTVKIIADEGSVEKTKNVTATFAAGHIKTLNVDFDKASVNEIITATVEEFLAASVSEDQWYQLTGTVSNITSTSYGNFDLTDETGTVYVYGLTATKVAKNDKSFSSLGIKEGDVITIISLRGEYKGTPQAGGNTNPAYFVSKEENNDPVFGVKKTDYQVPASTTSVKIEVTGNVEWTAEGSTGTTLDKTSGEGEGTITVSFPANASSAPVEYKVFVQTTADVETKKFEVDITQAAAVAGGVTIEWASYEDWEGVTLNTAGNATTGSDEISLTCGDYLVTISKGGGGTKPVVNLKDNDARAYAKGTVTVKNTKNVNMTSLVFNLSAQGLLRLAPVTASAGTVASQALGDQTVTWTGEATEVTFTVGEKANYGTDGDTKSGQLCFSSINVEEGGQGVAVTLSSIAVSGQKTTFTVGDTFTFDGTVTATYSNGTTKNVTSSATVSTPDLSSAGTKEVTVSYTEGGVTKTVKYEITVNAGAAHAGTLEDPYTVADALIATAALGEGHDSGSNKYYVKGVVSEAPASVSSGKATYMISDDGTSTSQMKVYNGYYIGNASFETADQVKSGDEVIVYGKLQYYKPSSGGDSELEISSSYIYELKRGGTAQSAFSAKASTTTVPSSATTVKINVYGNVAWTAAVTTPGTIDVSSGNGQGVITVSIPEYTDTEKDRAFVVTVATPGFDSIVITIWQQKKDASGAVTITGASALSAGMTETASAQSCTVEGITIDISNGLATSEQIRVYKYATITLTAPTGKNLKKVVFNCTASGTNNYGPGCFAEHDGYSFDGKVGTWEGSSNSLTLTASGGQVRAESIVVTCE